MLCILHSNCFSGKEKLCELRHLDFDKIEDIYISQFLECKICKLLNECFGPEFMLANFIVWYIKNFIYGDFCNVISANYIVGTTYDYKKKHKIHNSKISLKDSINYWKEIYKLK